MFPAALDISGSIAGFESWCAGGVGTSFSLLPFTPLVVGKAPGGAFVEGLEGELLLVSMGVGESLMAAIKAAYFSRSSFGRLSGCSKSECAAVEWLRF